LPGWETGVLLTAMANVLILVVLSAPPFQRLQPVQATSIDQWVLFLKDERVLYVALE